MNFKQTLFKIAINTISIFIVAWMLSNSIHLENNFAAILVAIVLVLLNTFLRPLLIMLTIPLTAITLGLFLLVINAGMVLLAEKIVPGFQITSESPFWTAFWFGILVPIVGFFLGLPEKIRQQQIVFKRMTNFEDPFFNQTSHNSDNSQDFQDAEIVDDEETNDDKKLN
ncbi:MAG: phage holin family protein [Bacteroidales bacterium]|jgi:putative membrane protein|nr:phage holin family protein [Bacteroidales bacterium]